MLFCFFECVVGSPTLRTCIGHDSPESFLIKNSINIEPYKFIKCDTKIKIELLCICISQRLVVICLFRNCSHSRLQHFSHSYSSRLLDVVLFILYMFYRVTIFINSYFFLLLNCFQLLEFIQFF